jgi:hypothetical protein
MKTEKKIDLILDVNQILKKEIQKSKLIKYAVGAIISVGAIVAVGYISKILNFTIHNVKELSKTIKTN